MTTRRGHGRGTLRADGKVEFRAMIDGRRRSFYAKTLGEAKRKAEDARGQWRPTQGGTVADFLRDWLAGNHDALKPQTWTRYESIVRLQIIPAIGGVPIAQLGEADLVRLQDGMKSKLSDTTRHHVHVVLGTALEDATRRGLIRVNPIRLVRAPRMAHRAKRPLTEAEARRLLDAAKSDPYEALYVLALTTGARLGELLALSWHDIDLEGARVTIRGNVVDDFDGTRRVMTPKTARGHRAVPITPVAVGVLAALQTRKGGDTATGLVFPGKRGRPLDGTFILHHHFHPLLERAGLPRMTFHTLRDTAATLLLQRGVPAHVVSFMLGHASVATTLSIYAHVTDGLEGQAMDAMQEIYG